MSEAFFGSCMYQFSWRLFGGPSWIQEFLIIDAHGLLPAEKNHSSRQRAEAPHRLVIVVLGGGGNLSGFIPQASLPLSFSLRKQFLPCDPLGCQAPPSSPPSSSEALCCRSWWVKLVPISFWGNICFLHKGSIV